MSITPLSTNTMPKKIDWEKVYSQLPPQVQNFVDTNAIVLSEQTKEKGQPLTYTDATETMTALIVFLINCR